MRGSSRYGRLARAITLPIPSTIPDVADAEDVRRFRALAAPDPSAPLIGHFGTYGDHMTAMIDSTFPRVAEHLPRARFAFVGDRSVEFLERLSNGHRVLHNRTWASGRLSRVDVAAALRACDFLVQPYPDGVTTRRTSVMAGLANGVPIVTTDGALTEAVWRETGAAALAPVHDPAYLVDAVRRFIDMPADRALLGRRGQRVYTTRFSIERTVETLREPPAPEVAAG